MDQTTTLRLVAGIAASGTFVTAAEVWSLRHVFAPGGLLDAAIVQPSSFRTLARLGAMRATPIVAVLRLCVAALVLADAITPGLSWLPLVVLAVLTCLSHLLLPYGRDGSDDMAVCVTVALAAASVVGTDSEAARVAVLALAAQSWLSYVVSGAAKLWGSAWRDGTAVALVAGTQSYGGKATAAWLGRHPLVSRWLTRGVVVGEVGVGVLLVLGGPLTWPTIAGIVAAHAVTAVLMGLNRFTFWFSAALPALAFAALRYGVLAT